MPSPSAGPAAIPRVAILVLNWNGWRDTVECLESLFRLDYPSFTVIVCDNWVTERCIDRSKTWGEGAPKEIGGVPPDPRALSYPPVTKPLAFAEYSRSSAESAAPMPVALP